jgi:hypothetical protein
MEFKYLCVLSDWTNTPRILSYLPQFGWKSFQFTYGISILIGFRARDWEHARSFSVAQNAKARQNFIGNGP